MGNCESLYTTGEELSDEIIELFNRVKSQIEKGVDDGWLENRNLMYIKDIEYMYAEESRFKPAGDGIDTIIHYVQENESNAPTEHETRNLMAQLGRLQSKLHKKSEYYN